MGLNCVFLLTGAIRISRKELQNYGWKCSLIGLPMRCSMCCFSWF